MPTTTRSPDGQENSCLRGSRSSFVASCLEAVVVLVGAAALAALMTYPLAFRIDQLGRIDSGDGQFSIWNVAWVAHALTTSPSRLFQANIFHPHRDTLAFSESNIGAGVLATPAYWLTGDPFVAHNVVVLITFTLSGVGAYFLVRHLTAHRGVAAIAGIAFAYCPYIFARTAHIQLLMTAGLPFSLLAFHRLVESPKVGRAVALGLVLAAQALSCAYYGVFAAGIVAVGALYYAVAGRRWRDDRYWAALAVAAAVSLWTVLPFFLPYSRIQQETGFVRSLAEAFAYSADWRSYLASAAWAHQWMLPWLGTWNDVLFPGSIVTVFGLFGAGLAVWGTRAPVRPSTGSPAPELTSSPVPELTSSSVDVVWPRFYVLIFLLALWMSFGPGAGLYAIVYDIVPVFSLLRAPSRFGLLVALALVVLMALAVVRLSERFRFSNRFFAVMAVVTAAELASMPLGLPHVRTLSDSYRVLAGLPRGPVIELPFFYNPVDFHRHSLYMVNSTSHWFPLVNGYSDYIPADFRAIAVPLSSFPTLESFQLLEKRGTRYAIFHLNLYDVRSREKLLQRLDQYQAFLRPLFRHDNVWLFEIVHYPR